jgi:hypothetical protein
MGIALALLWLFASQSAAASLDDELIAAARRGDVAAAKALLDKGANVDARGRYDVTPLMTAALRGNLALVRLLVERGADVNIKDTFYKTTPLAMALGGSEPRYEIVEYLLAHGAEDAAAALRAGIEANRLTLVRAALKTGTLSNEVLSDALLTAGRGSKPEVAALLREAGAAPPRVLDDALLQRYVGTWRSEDGFEMKLAADKGLLLATMPGSRPPMTLVPIDETTFRPAGIEGIRLQFTVSAGAVTGAVLETRSGKQGLKKIDD